MAMPTTSISFRILNISIPPASHLSDGRLCHSSCLATFRPKLESPGAAPQDRALVGFGLVHPTFNARLVVEAARPGGLVPSASPSETCTTKNPARSGDAATV